MFRYVGIFMLMVQLARLVPLPYLRSWKESGKRQTAKNSLEIMMMSWKFCAGVC